MSQRASLHQAPNAVYIIPDITPVKVSVTRDDQLRLKVNKADADDEGGPGRGRVEVAM